MTLQAGHVPSFVLVDDDEDDRLLMRMALEETNSPFHVIELTDGSELIDYLKKELGEKGSSRVLLLVIMDINMPIMDGREALVHMQKHPLWRQIPVMMMSTSDDPLQIQDLLTLGASSYVVKPKTYSGLVEHIKTTFAEWLPKLTSANL